MRNTYAVEYPLSGSPDPDDVARLWHSWITDRRGGPTLPNSLVAEPASDLAPTEIAAGQVLEQLRVDAEGRVQLALRWEHPDSSSGGVRWRTELAYIAAHREQPACFSCKLAVGRATTRISPTRRQTTRPKVVVNMLKSYPGIEQEPITHKPLLLRPADAGRFATFLGSDDRRRPVVLVSCRNIDDRPVIDPNAVAELLCGLAFVYVTEGRWPTLALRDHLPLHLVCRDGAVRIYWPGFGADRSGSGHPFWTPLDARRAAEDVDGGLPQVLLERIVEAAIYTTGAHTADWQRIESDRRRAQIERSRAAGDFERLAESYAAENDSLRQAADGLDEELRTASDELRQARNQSAYWRGMYETAMGNAGAAPVEGEGEVGSVADALNSAVAQHTGRIVLALNSASDADTPFSAPEEVYESLCFLATIFYDSKTGTKPCPDLDHTLRELTGWSYEAHQSQTAMGKHKSEYECVWDGRRHTLKAHMGTGTNKDPRHTIRIAFAWDEKKKVVVIGYVGQHQSNDRTS